MANFFNIRVYGIWILEDKVLVNEEHFRERVIYKFPGGGMDWGEGTIDCLKREWREEIDVEIEVLEHFYTTDFFQQSSFDGSQVISIYYKVSAPYQETFVNSMPSERSYWIYLKDLNNDIFTLPIDKIVGEMLQKMFHR